MDSYEKKYKDLLERARKLRDKNCDGCKMCMESLFDELAESEDEMIKKCIIDTLKGYHHLISTGGVTKEQMIAWLEKQGQSMTITIPKDLKGTDTDGGVVGEKGEQPSEPDLVGMGGLGKVWDEQAIISRLDRIIELLERPIIMPYQQPLQPLQPLYDTNKIYCDTASTEGCEQ